MCLNLVIKDIVWIVKLYNDTYIFNSLRIYAMWDFNNIIIILIFTIAPTVTGWANFTCYRL